jgi:hypothetical protein
MRTNMLGGTPGGLPYVLPYCVPGGVQSGVNITLVSAQEYRRLASRVAPAHHRDLLAFLQPDFGEIRLPLVPSDVGRFRTRRI